MKTLNQQEIKEVSGAMDGGKIATGIATLLGGGALALAAATPPGWAVTGLVLTAGAFGGTMIGDGIVEGDFYK